MKIKINNILLSFLAIALLMVCETVFAFYGVGYSSFPLQRDNKMVGVEMTGVIADGGGLGIQARYTHKTSKRAIVDAGLNVSGGDRNARIFAGLDYEIIPDYLKQPRVSLKATLENSHEFSFRRNILGLIPTVSKGFNVKGNEVYPYLAIPMGISLHSDNGTYKNVMNISVGANGAIPFKGYRHLTGNVEGMVNLKDSYTGVFAGISFPMN